MTDLTQFDTSAASQSTMHVTHPADPDKPLGPTITVAGLDSKIYRQTQMKLARQYVERQRKGKRAKQDDYDENLELVVACTVDWTDISLDGKKRPCDEKNKREVYERLPWLRDQVAEHIMDRENYFRDPGDQSGGADQASSEA